MSRALRNMKLMSLIPAVMVVAVVAATVSSCTIEPPLKLPSANDGYLVLGRVITNIEVIWGIDDEWRSQWWYGWDQDDVDRWGEIAYPVPTSYEARFYYYGEDLSVGRWSSVAKETVWETEFHRRFNYGYHDMLVWSNIDSHDGTQTVRVDESDLDNIFATTSRTRLSYEPPASRTTEIYNNPEIFYASDVNNLYMSRDTTDYDYYDTARNAWVKTFRADLYPLVYIYLVQVVIYNNKGRVVGIADNAAINSLADGVSIHTGHTSNHPVAVSYEMNFKKNLPARDARMADIFGGKFTTFGLCDMEPMSKTRAVSYTGSRGELRNSLSMRLNFSNAADSAYHFDITHQIQRQAHGGVITVEIDADTLTIPSGRGDPGGAGVFDPVIAPQDSISKEFVI